MNNINLLEGKVVAKEGMKVGIVAARFNEIVVSKLLSGAIDGLVRHNVKEENITAAWVPGAFELPTVAKKMAESGKYDAVIVLGAVIRGQTSHYELVCNEAAKGIAQISMQTGVPTMLELSRQRMLNRQSLVQEARLETRDTTAHYPQLRWLTS